MIEKYKKYLVLGYLRYYNPSVYKNTGGYSESGPHIAEVWAIDDKDAIISWENKVVIWGSYLKESFDVEVREL